MRCCSQGVQRAEEPGGAAVETVGIDHGSADVGVAEQLLHRVDVGAGLELTDRVAVEEEQADRAWFCVLAETCRSTARGGRNCSTSGAPIVLVWRKPSAVLWKRTDCSIQRT